MSTAVGSPLALALACSRWPRRLRGCGGRGARRQGRSVVASFYPLQYVAQRVVGRPRRRHQPHPARRRAARPRARRPADRRGRRRRRGGLREAASSRRRRRGRPERGPTHVVDAADAVAPRPVRRATTRTSGSTRPCWPQVADAFDEPAGEGRPGPRGRLRAATSPALQRRPRRARRATSARAWRAAATRTIVVSHDAFGYLGRRYGLDVRRRSPASPPTPSRRRRTSRELQDLIRTDEITTVFSERLASPQARRHASPATSASAPRCSTRSRASATRPPTRTTCP